MAPLASAFIRLRPDTSGFRNEADDAFDAAGRSSGRSFGEGFTRDASGRIRDARGRFAREFENGPPLRLPPIQPPDMPRIPDVDVDVDVDVSGARDKIQGLLVDISQLAKIPVGATLAVGVGSMVGAFGAAALGAGALKAVAVPAIESIKEALAAKEAQEKASAGTEAQGAQQSIALAGARQALAAALRNASYAHAQAIEGVRNAERDLADAQKGAVTAQRAIGDAREEAARQLQDMQRQLINSSLSLQADALSVDRAKQALDRLNDTRQDALALEQAQLSLRQAQARQKEVNSDKDSSQLDKDAADLAVRQAQEQVRAQQEVAKQRAFERKEAELAYKQAVQRYKDSQAQYKQQQKDARDAAKAGVEGSDQVRSAREALDSANRKVADSERALAKARADVGRADQASADAVASARRGLSQVFAAGSGDADKLAAALAKLTPEERKLYNDTVGLKDAFEEWGKSLQPKVLPLFSQGIGILQELLPSLTPVVEKASEAVGGLLNRVADGAKSPAFAAFRDAVVALVPRSMTALGNIAGDVAVGFGRIIQAFLPYAPATLDFLERMADKFRDMAGGATVSPGFSKFIQFVQDNGPMVASTASDIAQALAKVVTSLAPLGAGAGIGVLSTFGLLARLISSMSPEWIQRIAIAYAAVRVVLVGYKIATVAAAAISAVNVALATGNGPLWARALAGAWTGMKNVATAAKDGVVWLWNHARAAAASAASTLRLKAAAAGNWIASLVTGYWASARAAAASAVATLRLKAATVGAWISSAASSLAALVAGYWASARAGAAAALSSARNAVATAASAAASRIAAGAAAAWSAAQWLLNAALNANPIALIVIGIAALVASVILAYRNVGWFRDAVDAAWAGIRAAFAAAWGFIQPIFAAIRDWITGTLAPAFVYLWQTVIQPAFAGIGSLISAAWTNVIQPVLAAVWGFVTNTLAPAFMWLWQTVLAPVFAGIGALISAAWTNVIRPVLAAVWGFVTNTLAPAFTWLWQTIIAPVFAGIGTLISVAWTGVIRPILAAIWTFLSVTLGPIFTWLWKTIIQPAFTGIGLLIDVAWNDVIKPILAAIWTYINTVLGPIFTWLWKTIIQPVWAGIGLAIDTVWNNGIKPIFAALQTAVMAVANSFGVGADAIKIAWAKIEDYAKTPVNFVIGTVYNKGIRGLWNQVIDWLNLPKGMELGPIDMLEKGGTLGNPAAAKPMMTNGPMAIVGEGRRSFPEFVIPTDPKYRGRAKAMMGAAANRMDMQFLAPGGVLGGGDGWLDKIKDVAGGAVDLVDDALDLIANPKQVWDKLVGAIPKPNFPGPFGGAVNAIPKKITDAAWDVAEKIIKAFDEGYSTGDTGVVNAAAKYIGQGDTAKGGDNNNYFTKRYGWPKGTPWCALFASAAIQDAGAAGRYPGTPTAAVAGFNSAMKHVPIGAGRPGDLATYGANDHINIIAKKLKGGGYETIGGNEGPLVKRDVRGGQASVLRPMASGGLLSEVFGQRNFDPRDRRDPTTQALARMAPLFDSGGLLQPGPNNHTRRPEPVLTAQQWSALLTLAERGAQQGQVFGDVHVHDETDIDRLMERAEFVRRGKSF